MGFLKLLEGLRNPFLDEFFSLITRLGEETVFILAGLIFFWCVDKKKGYFILSVGFAGTVINQFLKLWFRIPRPWVKDKSFTIVESARAEATGYSFPSGHTQSALGVFGGIARFSRNTLVRVLCIIACVLVPLSRMYLGVHTPLDVGVSAAVAIILIFTLYPLINKACDNIRNMRIFFGIMIAVAAAFLAFVLIYKFPQNADSENISHGIQNAYKILGCVIGLYLAFELDWRFIKFDPKAVWWAQILKLVLGLIPILLIKTFLKAPLYSLLDGSYLADGIRYFLITAFAGGVWPISFKFFGNLGKKDKK